jgi:hypothetical protein
MMGDFPEKVEPVPLGKVAGSCVKFKGFYMKRRGWGASSFFAVEYGGKGRLELAQNHSEFAQKPKKNETRLKIRTKKQPNFGKKCLITQNPLKMAQNRLELAQN